MAATHTPGPWACTPVNGHVFKGLDPSRPLLTMHLAIVHAPEGLGRDRFDVQAANTRLIAAAPDMIQALQWALGQIEDDLDPDHQQALASAHAVVARATGEA